MVGDHLYVYGGHAGEAHHYSLATTRGNFLRLDLSSPDRWEELPGGPILQGLTLVAHGDKLYRLGGMQPHNEAGVKSDLHSQSGCAVYDPATATWSDIASFPQPRSSHDAVIVGDSIYVFGGWQLQGSLGKPIWHDRGLVLDLMNPGSAWEPLEQPFRRRALTVGTRRGQVFVIGGMNESNKVERTVNVFGTWDGGWHDGPPLPGDDSHGFTPSSCALHDELYVAPSDGTLLNLVDDSWQIVGEFQEKRFSARMVSHANRVVLLGGASNRGLLASVETLLSSQKS